MALLEIKNLTVAFGSAKSCFHAVEGVSRSVDPGEVLGDVGFDGKGAGKRSCDEICPTHCAEWH